MFMLYESPSFKDHEQVTFVSDPQTGLKAIIAIHSTAAGPAVGGTRMYPYTSTDQALDDVLRLSYGMTLKNIMAGLPAGGGKSVIIGVPQCDKTPALLQAFGRSVEALGGRYICAEDVGTDANDMLEIHRSTNYVTGLSQGQAASGDPSPSTALGVFTGIQEAVAFQLDRSDLAGLRVGVLGLGNVGWRMCELLVRADVRLIVADVNRTKVDIAVTQFGAQAVSPKELLTTEMDVFCPCALGGILTPESVAQLNTSVVAGAANNQLADENADIALYQRGILYAPDFVINAGGVINCVAEVENNYDAKRCRDRVVGIGTTLKQIFQSAYEQNLPTEHVAVKLAMEKLAQARRQGRAPVQQAA